MKLTIKKTVTSLLFAAAAMVSGVVITAGSAGAIGEGQIAGGDIYRIKNITKNSGYANTQTADKCETLQYKIRLHNPGPGIVNSVNVKVSLPNTVATTNVSTVTITGQNAQPATVTANATLNLSTAQKVNYVNGSTQLLNATSNVLSTLPDTITGSGVNIGNVAVSLNEIKFVQFQAKVDCPQPPCTPPNPDCTPPPPPPCTPPNPDCTPPPVVSTGVCKLLSLEVLNKDEREVKAVLTGQVNNATIVGYKIDFGDNTNSDQSTATHKYAKDGTYTVTGSVVIKFADNHTETKTAADCAKQITFKKDTPPVIVTPPPVTPVGTTPTPTALPATGPAGVAAIGAVITLFSSVAYHFVSRRFGSL